MSSKGNQTKTTRRIDGYPILNSPTADLVILKFNNSLKCFKYVSIDELVSAPYELQVSRGDIPNSSSIFIIGRTDLLSSTIRNIWNAPMNNLDLPSRITGSVIRVVSTSSQDIAGGTGLTSLVILGLDTDGNQIVEIILMNGTTPVVLNNNFTFINDMIMFDNGVLKTNQGNISAYHDNDPDKIMSWISIGEGTSKISAYRVPKDHTLFVKSFVDSTEKGVDTNTIFRIVTIEEGTVDTKFPLFQNSLEINSNYSIKIESLQTIQMLGTTMSGASKQLSTALTGILIKND